MGPRRHGRAMLAGAALTFALMAAMPALAAAGTASPVLAAGNGAPPAAPRQEAKKSFPESGEVLMQADNLSYDQDKRIVTATGHVEIAYGRRILMADRITYDENTGVVTADGHVSLLDPEGDVAFADHVVLRNELKDGVVQTLSVLLSDKSRLAGYDAVRTNGNITTVHRGVYSPCKICKEEGQRTPLWQLKAFRVIHNKEARRIVYEDAFMEFFGVPVMYVPFFSHPDPTVKRQSGFLTPSLASSTELGQEVTIPYFWAIAPNMDVTLAPRFTTKENIIYQGEFRHRIEEGQYRFLGTATWPRTVNPGQSDFRGSLFGNGEFNPAPEWNWGFQTQMSSDDTYLRKYDLSYQTELTNNLHLNHVRGRDALSVNAYYFRGLLPTSTRSTMPWVAPIVDYTHAFPGLYAGGRLGFNGNVMILGTPSGPDSRRVSGTVDWERPHTGASGEVYRLFASLRGDLYSTDDAPKTAIPGATYNNETIARGLPTAGIEISYPFVRPDSGLRQVIEPIAQIIYSPNVGNTDRIPNQDSLNLEFDDTNLFSENRFPGLDRWETGARASAGLRYSIYGANGGQASVLLGQSYRLKEDTSFSPVTGLRDQLSDYVGAIQVAPNNDLFAVHRFRVNRDSYKFSRNEFDVIARTGPLTTQLGYAYFAKDQSLTATLGAREQVSLGTVLRLSEYWRIFGNSVRDLANTQTISNEIGLGYQDDCFGLTFGFYQSNISYQDIRRSNTFLIQVAFKNLGSAGTGGRNIASTGVPQATSSAATVFGNPDTSLLGNPLATMFSGPSHR